MIPRMEPGFELPSELLLFSPPFPPPVLPFPDDAPAPPSSPPKSVEEKPLPLKELELVVPGIPTVTVVGLLLAPF
jgi:hypothetical protein